MTVESSGDTGVPIVKDVVLALGPEEEGNHRSPGVEALSGGRHAVSWWNGINLDLLTAAPSAH